MAMGLGYVSDPWCGIFLSIASRLGVPSRISPGPLAPRLPIFPNQLVDALPFMQLAPGTKIPMQAVPTAVAQATCTRAGLPAFRPR